MSKSIDDDDDEKAQLRARIRDLEAALGQSNENLAVTFRLTPVLNNLLGLLLSLPNVTSEMIRQRLEIATDAKVAIHRLRRHLEPWKIEIKSRRSLGYWLEDEDKEKIREAVAARIGTPPLPRPPAITSEVTNNLAA